MTPAQSKTETGRRDPVFHGGSFEVSHFTSDAEGLQIVAEGIGKTALAPAAISLDDEQKTAIRDTVWGEMRFSKAPLVSEVASARLTAHQAKLSGNLALANKTMETIHSIQRSEGYKNQREALKENGLGKKIGFRDIHIDPDNPNRLVASAQFVPFYMYNRFATPANREKSLGHLSEAAGVAMALVTADRRLIIQHRAVAHRDLDTSKMKPGNASYNAIPGASMAGMIDATARSTARKPGAPDTVTTDSLTALITREAGEELGLHPDQLSSARIVGLAHDNIKPHDEVLFLAETSLTADEVRQESVHSSRNKNLPEADLAEKFLEFPATPEAIFTLLSEVKCPLPPTHAAAFVACGFMMVLEQTGSRVEAESWASQLEAAVQNNYLAMDSLVQSYYQSHPEALQLVPERMWSKPMERNPLGYSPHFTPSEQGLPELEDELVRTGLVTETRTKIPAARLFDVDGVLVNPKTKEISDPAIISEIANCLKRGEAVALNTGRSTTWVEEKIVSRLREHIDDPTIYRNFMVIGEKGGSWITFDEEGSAIHGQAPDLGIDETLRDSIAQLVIDEFGDSMFLDTTKQTMISVEMRDGYGLNEYRAIQARFTVKLTNLLAAQSNTAHKLKIDATTIAVDIENPYVGKALGVERFIELLKARNIAYSEARFTAYGDSPSDAAMADELERRGLSVSFVFVGDTTKFEPNHRYPVISSSGGETYEAATLSHLRNTALKNTPRPEGRG